MGWVKEAKANVVGTHAAREPGDCWACGGSGHTSDGDPCPVCDRKDR
jgi:hypothetical protein